LKAEGDVIFKIWWLN